MTSFRRTLASLLLATSATLGAAACGGHATHIATTATLGKVVVYRSGVAFYERRAHLEDGTLTVRVPRNRVDDFLKSMTIVDSATGEHLPITIPRQQAQGGDYLVMDLYTPGRRKADVVLTYVTEAPAWKPSYRITVDGDDQLRLEGWAVVDNTSGEDWNDVLVGVGSSSALSFRYDLWSVRSVSRELVAEREVRAIAPPTSVSPFAAGGEAAHDGLTVVAVFDEQGRGWDTNIKTDLGITLDSEYLKNIPVPGRTYDGALGAAAGLSVGGATSVENQYYIDGVSTEGMRFGTAGETITISGSAPLIDTSATGTSTTLRGRGGRSVEVGTGATGAPGPAPTSAAEARRDYTQFAAMARRMEATAGLLVIQHGGAELPRAEAIRDQLVDAGLAAPRVRLASSDAPGLRVVLLPEGLDETGRPTAATPGQPAPPDDEPVGESHFMGTVPLDVPAATSAMVAVLSAETAGDVAYLYDPVSERGDARFAFRAMRLENPTDETLEAGPLTVYGDAKFIGEGLLDAVPPRATTVVPFAQDRQVVVDAKTWTSDKLTAIHGIDKRTLRAGLEQRRHKEFTIHNRLTTATTVYVRQPIDPSWTLVEAPEERLRLPTSHLIPVQVPAGGSATLTLVEAAEQTREVAMEGGAAGRLLRGYLADGQLTPALRTAVTELLEAAAAIDRAGAEIASYREQQAAYDERARELHAQLVTLKAVKTAGPLIADLGAKLTELTTLSQRATLQIAAAQDRLAIAKATHVAHLLALGATLATDAAAARPAVASATP